MNVKSKIISILMSFVICFSVVGNSFANDKKQLNYNIEPLVFDGGVISAPMLATVSALAVGTGIVIKNSDDIYDIGKMFYNYISSHNSLTWDFVNSAFVAGHTLINNYVHVDSNFLDIVKGFFDSEIKGKEEIGSISSTFGIPYFDDNISDFSKYYSHCLPISATTSDTNFGDFTLKYLGAYDNFRNNYDIYYKDINVLSNLDIYFDGNEANWIPRVYIITYPNNSSYYYVGFVYKTPRLGYVGGGGFTISKTYANTISFPYNGGYTWDNVESKKENDSVSLPIPGDLGQLVGQGSDEFWDNTDGLVGGGSISLPGVDNPSVDVTDDVFVGNPSVDVPGTDSPSIPNDSIWSTIKDFVVSLVVPSDTFWTDTFNGFRENFSKNFPMLDMSKFDSLAVGGKPFPNLYAYGSKIVDGDVINSIVDWLRPIIAGFIMICLMFFNYRKIYKLIRNTEPFGGIAQGSSDFRTGLSAPPINNGLDSNPLGNLRDTLFDMRNEILRRENSK